MNGQREEQIQELLREILRRDSGEAEELRVKLAVILYENKQQPVYK